MKIPTSTGQYSTLLWTNPNSYATGFPAQTVSLDLSKYKAVIVTPLTYPEAGYTLPVKSYCPIGQSSFIAIEGSSGTLQTGHQSRKYTVSTTGVTFDIGYSQGHYTSPTYCPPYQIWGVEFDSP